MDVRFGEALRAHRIAADLTQEQLAERAGLSVRGVRDLERGRVSRPRRETIRLLTDALGLDETGSENLLRLAGHTPPLTVEPCPESAYEPEPAAEEARDVPGDPVTDEAAERSQAQVQRLAPVPPDNSGWSSRRWRLTAAAAAAVAGIAVVPLLSSTSGHGPRGTAAYVGRVAADAQLVYSTGAVLRAVRPITAGDAVVAAVMLTSTTQAEVSVTDSAGNRYAMVADVFDAYRHRTMIFTAFKVKPLPSGGRIELTWPRSSKYHAAVDEFHGVTAAWGRAAGSGLYGDHERQRIAVGLATGCAAGDLVIAAVGSNSGPAPLLEGGWQRLPELKLSSYRLTVAHRRATRRNDCALTGTSQAQWEVALISLR